MSSRDFALFRIASQCLSSAGYLVDENVHVEDEQLVVR
jgi:hypothetical protein